MDTLITVAEGKLRAVRHVQGWIGWIEGETFPSVAAEVAVGTVDQAMLAALKVKHSEMRASALSRNLLVIDEVHASDAYMRHVQTALLRQHMALGGHAMLMSATLGAVARAEWLGHAYPTWRLHRQQHTRQSGWPVRPNQSLRIHRRRARQSRLSSSPTGRWKQLRRLP